MDSHTREQKWFLSQIFFCKSISIFLSLSFFPLSFLFISSFAAHFIIFLLHRIVAGWLFFIGKNIQNEVSLERSIFAAIVAYQFISCEQRPYNPPCLVPRPHYYVWPMCFGSRGPGKFLRPRQTRRSETFCLTRGGAFGSGRAVNNFSSLMKDVQQPWRVQNRAFFSLSNVLWPFFFIYLIKLIWTLFHLKNYL